MHFRPLTFVILLSVATAGLTQTYKWVDQDGVVSYSQTPPPSSQAERVDIKPATGATPTDSNNELKRLRQRLEDNREDRELAQQAQSKARQAADIKQQNCTAARSNLDKLLNSGNRMMKTTDGGYLRLNESERQSRIQAAREQIEVNCKK